MHTYEGFPKSGVPFWGNFGLPYVKGDPRDCNDPSALSGSEAAIVPAAHRYFVQLARFFGARMLAKIWYFTKMRGPQHRPPKYYDPYYGDPQKGTPNFGKPHLLLTGCFHCQKSRTRVPAKQDDLDPQIL